MTYPGKGSSSTYIYRSTKVRGGIATPLVFEGRVKYMSTLPPVFEMEKNDSHMLLKVTDQQSVVLKIADHKV